MRTAQSCYQAILQGCSIPHRPRLMLCWSPSDQTFCFLWQPQPLGLEESGVTSQGPDQAPQKGKHTGRSRAGAVQQGKHSLKQGLYSLKVRQSCPRVALPPQLTPLLQQATLYSTNHPASPHKNRGKKLKVTLAAHNTK